MCNLKQGEIEMTRNEKLYKLGQETIRLHGICCKELDAKVRIETPINNAPSYQEYLRVCKEFTAIAKVK
jgi:hypothetical protein